MSKGAFPQGFMELTSEVPTVEEFLREVSGWQFS